jgi:hypothetical protein
VAGIDKIARACASAVAASWRKLSGELGKLTRVGADLVARVRQALVYALVSGTLAPYVLSQCAAGRSNGAGLRPHYGCGQPGTDLMYSRSGPSVSGTKWLSK